MYKLIALDMDGTLLDDNKNISKANFQAIQEAKAKGVTVTLSTGRPTKGIEKYLKELDLLSENDYSVAFNGAIIQNTKTNEVISKKTLTMKDLKFIHKISVDLGANILICTPDYYITDEINEFSDYESKMNGIPIKVMNIDDVDSNTDIVKIMFTNSKEKIDEIISKLPKEVYEEYTAVRSCDIFLEFLNKEVNKGFGVGSLAKHLGIKQSEVICMGDAENDLAMIEYAGLGVAMENASEDVKSIANYITKKNVEDGVAFVINKFVLNK